MREDSTGPVRRDHLLHRKIDRVCLVICFVYSCVFLVLSLRGRKRFNAMHLIVLNSFTCVSLILVVLARNGDSRLRARIGDLEWIDRLKCFGDSVVRDLLHGVCLLDSDGSLYTRANHLLYTSIAFLEHSPCADRHCWGSGTRICGHWQYQC